MFAVVKTLGVKGSCEFHCYRVTPTPIKALTRGKINLVLIKVGPKSTNEM